VREKNQTVHHWNWADKPIDAEGVAENSTFVASDKALAHAQSVQREFNRHLKKNKKASVSFENQNY
jgi:hypothetical protein